MNHNIEVGNTYRINVGIAAEVLCVGRYEVFIRVIDTNERPLNSNSISEGREYTISLVQAVNDWKIIKVNKSGDE